MQDIAKHLGLSRSTISSILNNKWKAKNIRESTADRVLDYVDEIGYSPNLISLTLKGKVKKELAIILPLNCLEHQKKVFFTILKVLQEDKTNFLILPYSNNFNEISQSLSAYKISKVILLAGSFKHSDYDKLSKLAAKNKKTSFFLYDFRKELLFSKGTNIPQNVSGTGISYLEYNKCAFSFIADAGYKKAVVSPNILEDKILVSYIKKLGISISYEQSFRYLRENRISLIEKGERIAKTILDLNIRQFPILVYIADDLMTIGAINHLQKLKYKIPEEFAFMSWDGLDESEFFSTPLTTLSIPHNKMIDRIKKWLNDGGKESFLYYEKPKIRQGKSM